jgi:phage baseplate assembly protein W
MANYKFRDLDLDFLSHPATGDIVGKTDVDAIRRALRNLILFRKGEKPFHPEIASGVKDLLFEPATPITAIRLQNEITRVIKTYEPRVILDSVGVNLNSGGTSFSIDIQFTVQNTLRKGTVSFSLERLR